MSFILDYANWKKVFEAAGVDLQSLADTATQNDSEEVKAKTVYTPIIEWWKNASGDSKKRAEDSLRLWSGEASNVSQAKNYETFFKVLDSVIANKDKLTAAGVSGEKIDNLAQIKTKLSTLKNNGFILKDKNYLAAFLPSAVIDNEFSLSNGKKLVVTDSLAKTPVDERLIAIFKNWKNGVTLQSDLQKQDSPEKAMDFLNSQSTKKGQPYFVSAAQITEQDKISLLDFFGQKASDYASKNKIDIATAVKKAKTVFILPKGQAIDYSSTPAGDDGVIKGMFPKNPDGNTNDPSFIQAKNFFKDDSTELKPETKTALAAAIAEFIADVKSKGWKPVSATTWATSSTSTVPSRFNPATGKADPTLAATPENNVALSNARLQAMHEAIKAEFAANGVTTVTRDTSKEVTSPNNGPVWDPKKFTSAYRATPAGQQDYENTYGEWRNAFGLFNLIVEKPFPRSPEEFAVPKTSWNAVIRWTDPVQDTGNFGKPRKNPKPQFVKGTPCPVF